MENEKEMVTARWSLCNYECDDNKSICMHCNKEIYELEHANAPEGQENLYCEISMKHTSTNRSFKIHFYCLMDMIEWVSNSMNGTK